MKQVFGIYGIILQISLFASIFIIILLLAVLLRVVYRARKNNRRYPEVSTGRSASNVEYITRDSPVIYAAVVRPNRKPVRSVEQSDLMYGKMPKPQTSDQERDNKAKCLDINISNNPEGEGLKIGFSTTYSFVRNPDRTLSQDLGQCDQAYGNMTTRV
nr:uncharacterized protein LOC117680553 [Crassostrea gigas]